ncbi:MAG: mechanosensitive ion channel [bacterium]
MNIFETSFEYLGQTIGFQVFHLVAALVILAVGWVIALVVSRLVRAALHRMKLDDRLTRGVAGEEEDTRPIKAEWWISKGVFYLLLILVLVAAFQALGLTFIIEPLNILLGNVSNYLPRLVGAILLVVIAWIVASALRLAVAKILTLAKIDKRLAGMADLEGEEPLSLAKTIGDAVYWLVFLFFLPAILHALALHGLLEPVQEMFTRIFEFLPNLIAAGLIVAVGWFLARFVRRSATDLLAAAGTDQLSERMGLASVLGKQRLSGLLGLIAYIFVLIPVLIAALNALNLDAVTLPATNMLNTILAAIPRVFAAILLIAIAYIIGRVVARIVVNLLTGLGFDRVTTRLGIGKESAEGVRTPSEIAGSVVLVAIILLATLEALHLLDFVMLADLLNRFLVLAGHVILGLLIFFVGVYLANLASTILKSSGATYAGLLAIGARIAILVFAGAIALRQMGLANEIIVLAFGLLFGCAAVAVAIAFGVGGTKIAARKIEEWLESEKAKNRKEQG